MRATRSAGIVSRSAFHVLASAPVRFRGARRPIAAHHFAVHDVEPFGRRLQQFGRHFDRLGPDRARRNARRFAGHHCDPGGEGAHWARQKPPDIED
jgi:hypothetical protein